MKKLGRGLVVLDHVNEIAIKMLIDHHLVSRASDYCGSIFAVPNVMRPRQQRRQRFADWNRRSKRHRIMADELEPCPSCGDRKTFPPCTFCDD